MNVRTQITRQAHARGFTAAEVARRLGLYRSNISAMDAGKRSISLNKLAQIAEFLGVAPGDLIEVNKAPALLNPGLSRLAETKEERAMSENGKKWVHTVQLSWKKHFEKARRLNKT